MALRTRITSIARARGMSAAEVARRLGWYRSNLSLMDSGKRPVSLRALARIAQLLDVSPADLIEMTSDSKPFPFRDSETLRRLEEKDRSLPDGTERGWVHTALLAWQRHYRSVPSQP